MPYQHVAQQPIAAGKLRTDPLVPSPIGAAMLDTVRAITLQVRCIEKVLHQGTPHGGAAVKQSLAALQTDVDDLNEWLQALRCIADAFFHDVSEGLTVLCLHISLVEEELGRPLSAPSTQLQASLTAIKAAAIRLQTVAKRGRSTTGPGLDVGRQGGERL